MLTHKYCFLIFINLLLSFTCSKASDVAGKLNAEINQKSPSNDVFIKVASSKQVVYAGEAFIVKYLLYNAVSVIDPQTEFEINFKNCYQEQYPANQSQGTEKVNGKLYHVITLKQYLVIASDTGKLLLPRLKMHIKISASAGDDFFGQEKLISKVLYSNAPAIIINALPPRRDTISFSGAVGVFKIKGYYKASLKTPNLLVFHLIIDGDGNTKTVALATPRLPEGFDIYNITTDRKDTLTTYGIKTHLEYTFQLVSNYKGQFAAPTVVFSFFDPKINRYEIFGSSPYYWTVNTGPSRPSFTSSVHKQPIELYVKNSLTDPVSTIHPFSGWYFTLCLIGLMLIIYSYQAAYFKKVTATYFKKVNSKRLRSQTLKKIKMLINSSSGLDDDMFCKKATAIFYQHLNEKSNSDNKEISDLVFDSRLLLQQLPDPLYEEAVAFLDSQHRARFGAVKLYPIDKSQVCHQLGVIVNKVNSNWNA